MQILICLGALLCSACATRIVPVGEWGRPADLFLHNESLKGVKIAVNCARMDRNGKLIMQSYRLCAGLTARLDTMGALTDLSEEPADLTFWFVDLGFQPADSSGLSQLGFYFSGGIVPMITTRTVRAEIRITDARGVLLDRAPLSLLEINTVGWGALLGFYQESEQQQQYDVSNKVYRFSVNRIASQVVRFHLAGDVN